MNTADLATLAGYIVSAWCLGFSVGYTITKYKDALSQVS